MSRDFYINGESLVLVKGRTDSNIASLSQLGLSDAPIRVGLSFQHRDIKVDAWGDAPPETQFMLAWADISITLVHFDPDILDTCLQLSMAGAPAIGQLARAGQRMGNNLPRFAPSQVNPATGLLAGNNFIGLNIASPVQGRPWRFYYAYMTSPPIEFPLGTEKSVVGTQWKAIPYTQDPAGISNGTIFGAYGSIIWDRVLDS